MGAHTSGPPNKLRTAVVHRGQKKKKKKKIHGSSHNRSSHAPKKRKHG